MHALTFQRSRLTGRWWCACSCGWRAFGAEDAVKNAAATHDLDLEAA